MASSRDNDRRTRLPIKLILPRQGREKKVPGGGSPKVPFREVTAELRQGLCRQVDKIQDIAAAVRTVNSVPLRVKLLPNSLAKSHRPEHLFSARTCPIIGAGRGGELFLRGSQENLAALSEVIRTGNSAQLIKEISSIDAIEPVTPLLRRGGQTSLDVLRTSPKRDQSFVTRVRLFDYDDPDEQSSIVRQFIAECASRKLGWDGNAYTESSFTFSVSCKSVEDVEALSRVVGVRSIGRMPSIRTLRPKVFNSKALVTDHLPAPGSTDFPVVVVVDTGIADTIPALEKWVVGRDSDVAERYRNPEHGTFVAGLICFGAQLNPNIPGLSEDPCGVFDLQIVPNYDPAKGETDALLESEFLQSLENALRTHANSYRVWNLSLGTNEVCSLDEFSALAEQLDNLQEKYQVLFVISAGNYEQPPLLDYPRTPVQLAEGRITSPGDSVLAVTVGSVSHMDYQRRGPKTHQPSAFSRHGAGPNHVIKPDLVHYGGSCSTDSSHASGIRSLTASGSAEDLGTSFATPLVSRSLAQIAHAITPSPSPTLVRALLTHHARDPRSGGRVPDGDENFFGFGLPSPPPYCLECSAHSATMVFEDTLRPGYFLEWDDFPYPPSLHRSGRYFGEVWMTLAFRPARGARWGAEYCETHIDAHLGVYYQKKSRKTGQSTTQFKGLVPPEHKNPGLLYESYQVERLRKWAPVRTYHGVLGATGERGDRWRLMLRMLTRHGVETDSTFKPQPFALIVTIADPLRTAPVYDEISRLVRSRFQAEDLAVRAQMHVRTTRETDR